MKLSVSIVNYKVEEELFNSLHSLSSSLKDISHEIIVSDNHFLEGVKERILNQFPDIIWIQNDENIGFGRAHNKALKNAKGEFFAIVNPDVIVGPSTFLQIFDTYRSLEKPGIIGVQMLDEKGNFLPESKRNIPTFWNAFLKFISLPLTNKTPYYAEHIDSNENGEVDVLSGAFMLVHRNVFEELKGFDERYFLYAEDIDISVESVHLGYRNYYLGQISITHKKGRSMKKNAESRKYFYQTMQQYIDKHYKNPIQKGILHFLIDLQFLREKWTKKSDT